MNLINLVMVNLQPDKPETGSNEEDCRAKEVGILKTLMRADLNLEEQNFSKALQLIRSLDLAGTPEDIEQFSAQQIDQFLASEILKRHKFIIYTKIMDSNS